MGRKNKKQHDDQGDGDEFKEGDFTKGYVSHKANVAMEAAAAHRDQGLLDMGADSDDENNNGQKMSKKQKNKRKQNKQEDEQFDDAKVEQIKAKNSDGESDGPGADDIKKAMEENFEGAGAKRNTRKKKNNQGGLQEDAFAGVFDDHSGSDKDEVYNKKGGYKNKKDKHQGKKKKKQQESEDEVEPQVEEEEKVTEPETKVEEPEEAGDVPEFPLVVYYCPKCKLPPEYCQFGQKDYSECKQSLKENKPLLFKQIYGDEADGEEEAKGGEESKDPEANKEEGEEEKKPKKKVKFTKEEGLITVYKQMRGGKKTVCQMLGFEYYTKDLKGLASKFGKKFSCGCNLAKDDILGDCISVQGDIEYRLEELIESDKDLQKLEIPVAKIRYEEMGNKKGRKRG